MKIKKILSNKRTNMATLGLPLSHFYQLLPYFKDALKIENHIHEGKIELHEVISGTGQCSINVQ